MSIAIKAENISKAYQIGEFSTGTISNDIDRWWKLMRGKEDPYLKIGETNDRSKKGTSDVVWSLKDINFEIQQGDAVGIIGKNGAGKSTLLKILSRVTTPTTGNVKVKGRIASLLEVGTGFHPELTGKENIFLNGAILGMRKHEIKKHFDAIVDFSGVERYIDTPVKRYSSGMYVRLAFAVAAHLESEILIVDEVLAVGDAEFQKKCLGKMGEVSKGEGKTILFVSHNMAAVKNLCTKGVILKNGNVHFQGTSSECVEEYSLLGIDTTTTDKKFISFDDSFRKWSNYHNRIIDFVSISVCNNFELNNNYATNEIIEFKISLKGKKDVKSFRIAGSVFTLEEINIGTFFGQENLSIKENEEIEVLIKLKDHQLAKGVYYMDFSVGTGDHTQGISDFDHVYRSFYFEIVYADKVSKQMIPVWPSNWGNINFQDVEILKIGK